MSKICIITNKKNIIGNKISNSKKKNKRKFYVNFIKKKILFKNKIYKINISTSGLRTIKKKKININNIINYEKKK
ncbi:MAG: 50S ribosomal protein L28 [Candidatus Shikimatogenerans sp. Ttur]|uniref:Large ribosomal subunit protein bL28 n=1 Tax=Candidatus Shikimatogenerans sp. Ttur TaxID=3158569 RepID=A0AAU7ZXF3_9FLAO